MELVELVVLVCPGLRSFLGCGTCSANAMKLLSKPAVLVQRPTYPPQQYKDLTTDKSNNMDEFQNVMLNE